MIYLHKRPDHQCERVVDLEAKQRADFRTAIEESKEKASSFSDLSSKLDGFLSELQSQHDNACDLIKETFQSFKGVLEKRKVTGVALCCWVPWWVVIVVVVACSASLQNLLV